MNLLLEDEVIEWKGNLKDTYYTYLSPDKLDYEDPKIWDNLNNGRVKDCFQFETMVGSQAVKIIKPQSLLELATSNSLMRLMADEGGEMPTLTYAKRKANINLWYEDMYSHELNDEEIKILEKYLLPSYGLADNQELAMRIVMEKNISCFSLKEANALRKAIAKKKSNVLQTTKEMFYNKGYENNTRKQMLDYVWNVVLKTQFGYVMNARI